MTEATQCLQCGAELPPHFPPGVCPACLLQQGMSPSTLTGVVGDVNGGSGSGAGTRRGWIPPTVEELTPKFPQWEIVALLGQGGMGAVYKVRQRELDRWAALKVLPDEVASDPNFAERFQREARTLAQLSHQHIVTVYEFGQHDGVFYLLMEFVDGVTLRQAIRAGLVADAEAIRPSGLSLQSLTPNEAAAPTKPLEAPRHISPSAALGIVGQICDALQFAHEEGIVHRDIKPENILIDKRGRVKIADFGLAKLLGKQPNFPSLTGTHQIMGTPVYMAPEQMEGTKGVDHRADIFSLGVVFYELLTGELPLGRFAPPSQKYALDVRLDEIVLRTLEKEPGRRYQQASQVKGDVESIRSSSPPAMKAANALGSELHEATERQSLQNSWSRVILHSLIAFLMTGCGFGFVIGIPVFINSHNSNPELAKQPAMLALMVGFNLVGIAVCGYVAFHQARCAWLWLQAIVSISSLKAEEAVRKLKANFGQQSGVDEKPPQVSALPDSSSRPPVNEVARSIEKLITALVCIAFGMAAVFGFIVWSDAGSPYKELAVGFGRLGALIVVVGVAVAVWGGHRQRVTAEDGGVERPRSTRSLARLAYLVSVIAMGTFAGLVGCVFVLNWVYDTRPQYSDAAQVAPSAQPSDVVIVTAAQKEEAIKRYVAGVEQQKREQQAEAAAVRDPYEANAIVQFTTDTVKLHPDAFGSDEMTPAHRATLEKIMTDIHQQYLAAEAKHSQTTEVNGIRQVTIMPFFEEFHALEERLWTKIDEQLPVSVQKLLRARLPLYANQQGPSPLIANDGSAMSGGGAMSMPPGMGGMGGGRDMIAGGAVPPNSFRYQQLLGWNQGQLPLRITFGRRGKWYRWSILQSRIFTGLGSAGNPYSEGVSNVTPAAAAPSGSQAAMSAPNAITPAPDPFKTAIELDSGEAPTLPSGLRRFWQKPEAVSQLNDGDNPFDTEVADESDKFVVWTSDGVRLSHPFAKEINLEGEKLAQVNAIFAETWRNYIALEARHTEYSTTPSGEKVAIIAPFDDEQKKHEAAFWKQIDELVDASTSEAMHKSWLTILISDARLPSLFGWGTRSEKIKITIWRKGNWFHWSTRNKRDSDGLEYGRGDGNAASLPPELAHYWKAMKAERMTEPEDADSGPVSAVDLGSSSKNLQTALVEMDRLRAADKTPWDEVEKRVTQLLTDNRSPEDKGRIHWMAAHVYGQSDIRGHGADVTRHAKEALKFERDPVQRGWLYMYLGNAAGLVEKKDEATRWYLKGTLELLAFNLPDQKPELPSVGKFRGKRVGTADGEVDPDEILAEVQQAAEMKARKEAELICELVDRRNVYIGLLQDLYGREYMPESDATTTLKKLAAEVLRDEAAVTRLLQRVWPASIPKPNPTQSTQT